MSAAAKFGVGNLTAIVSHHHKSEIAERSALGRLASETRWQAGTEV